MSDHWNTVYSTKQSTEVSWYEAYPQHSVDTIKGFKLPKTTAIVDVGGGDSRLVDALLDLGYTNLTVLDISAQVLKRAKEPLTRKTFLAAAESTDKLDVGMTEKISYSPTDHQGLNRVFFVSPKDGKFVELTDWKPLK